MNFAVLLDQPHVERPDAGRRLIFGGAEKPAFAILNGHGALFEGGADSPELSLKWIAQGEAEYRSEGRSYRLAGATQLLLNRGQPYRMKMRGPSESFVLFFPKAAVDAAWQAQSGRVEAIPEIPSAAELATPALLIRLAQLRAETNVTKPDGERLHELCCAVLGEVVTLAVRRREQAARVPALRKATQEELLRRLLRAQAYLSDSGTKATLAGAARAASLSPFHLIRLFDGVFGQTPLAYAAARRLETARTLLAGTQSPIAEIARNAGYESRTAFDRAFARRFRMTPGSIRGR